MPPVPRPPNDPLLEWSAPSGRVVSRVYPGSSTGAGSRGLMVFFPPGGFAVADLDASEDCMKEFALACQVTVLASGYAVAPEHPFPAAVEDALAATCWASEHALQLGIDPRRLAIGGDSVGGGLAAGVAQNPAAPPLALQMLLCPILDLANASASRRAYAEGFFLDAATLAADLQDYCGATPDLADPRLSPLLAKDLPRQPPALIHAAEYDPFRDEAEAYAKRLAQAGGSARFTSWPGLIHYFYCLSRVIPAATPALETIGAEIGAALA